MKPSTGIGIQNSKKLGNPAANQISRNISKIKPKTRGNSTPITAPKTAPAALTAATPLKPSSGNESNKKNYTIGVMILNRKAPNSAATVRLIILFFLNRNSGSEVSFGIDGPHEKIIYKKF